MKVVDIQEPCCSLITSKINNYCTQKSTVTTWHIMKTFILLVDVSLILLISSQATNQNTRNITIYVCAVYLSLIKF